MARGRAARRKDKPSTYIDRFYYDTVTFTERNLRFLLDVLGSERVVFGTDWPAPMQVYDAGRALPAGRLPQGLSATTCCGDRGRDLRDELTEREATRVAKPKVFAVQPMMEVGRRALEEFADVEVFDSDRMISKPELLNGPATATTSGCSATPRSTSR